MIRIELRIEHLCQSADRSALSTVVIVERSYVADDVSHLVDCVVSSLRSASVAGDALDVDSDLHAASVSAVYSAVCRLCRDDKVDLRSGILRSVKVLVDDVLPAHSVAVLFHDRTYDHDLVSFRDEPEVLHDLCSVYGACHAAFLVGSAAAVDDIIRFITFVWIRFPVVDVSDADCVDVRVDGDDLVAVSHPADDVAKSVKLRLVVTEFFHLCLDAFGYFLLLRALARMRDHISEEPAHIRSVFFCSFFYRFIIRCHLIPPL